MLFGAVQLHRYERYLFFCGQLYDKILQLPGDSAKKVKGDFLNFSSVSFIFLLFPVSVILYALTNVIFRRNITVQNIVLCLMSLVFYAFAGMQSLSVVLGLVFVNYIIGYIARVKKQQNNKSYIYIYMGIAFNILLLAVFKYPQAIADALGSTEPLTALYPLGISFISFHCISYLVDILHQQEPSAVKNEANEFLIFATYILFFPKIAQGPIVRYADMRSELEKRDFTIEQISRGCERFLIGLTKKVLLADQLGSILSTMPKQGHLDAPTAWLGVAVYGFQLYFDFSGYSDMAIGLSLIFGFHFKENFNFPYLSSSITEFWQRWHISLGNWFKEYAYIPLGGSRQGSVYLNLFIVFLLTGIWHGNTKIYICWGVAHGILRVAERTPLYMRLKGKRWFTVFGRIYTLAAVFIGWLCFRLPNVSSFLLYLKNMVGLDVGELTYTWQYFFDVKTITLLLVSVLGIFLCSRKKLRELYTKVMQYPLCTCIKYIVLLVLFALCYTAILSNGYSPFLYFQY